MTTALRLGLGRLLACRGGVISGSGGINEYLEQLLGHPVHVAASFGPPRANRKAVLLVLDPRGCPAAYAKVGVNQLTDSLVISEAAALRYLETNPPAGLIYPKLIHAGEWEGLQLTLQEPLDTAGAAAPSLAALVSPMRAVAHSTSEDGHLLSFPAWSETRSKLDRLAGVQAGILRDRAAHVERLAGHLPIRIGAWHGDWTPWNVAVRESQTLAWDWERFATGVPVGWDALHWSIHHGVGVRGLSLLEAAHGMLAARSAIIGLCSPGVASPTTVACAYLVAIGTRYLGDRQDEAGAAAGLLENWLIPVLDAGIAELEGGQQ